VARAVVDPGLMGKSGPVRGISGDGPDVSGMPESFRLTCPGERGSSVKNAACEVENIWSICWLGREASTRSCGG